MRVPPSPLLPSGVIDEAPFVDVDDEETNFPVFESRVTSHIRAVPSADAEAHNARVFA
jgi:hypothetical protein